MATITLSNGKLSLIDDDINDYLNQFNWFELNGYAARYIRINDKQKVILMHREIMSATPNLTIDHINLNRLDNRKNNLRFCTPAENTYNRPKRKNTSSKYKGVILFKLRQKWMARIRKDNKYYFLGYFDNELDAAKAYNKAAPKFFGQYCRLNEVI